MTNSRRRLWLPDPHFRTCQRLVRQGQIIREKINAVDRRKWGHRWPSGYARRQTHFSLSPEMFGLMADETNFNDWLGEDQRLQRAVDRKWGKSSCGDYNGYRIPGDWFDRSFSARGERIYRRAPVDGLSPFVASTALQWREQDDENQCLVVGDLQESFY